MGNIHRKHESVVLAIIALSLFAINVSADWNPFHGNIYATGYSPNTPTPTNTTAAWSLVVTNTNPSFGAVPTIVGNYTYVASGNQVRKYSLLDGSLIWNFSAFGTGLFGTSDGMMVGVGNGKVVAAESFPSTKRIYVLDDSSGARICNRTISGASATYTPGPLVLSDLNLFIAGGGFIGNDEVWNAYNLSTCGIIWTYHCGNGYVDGGSIGWTPGASSSSDGTYAYLPCMDFNPGYEPALNSVYLSSGTQRWRYSASGLTGITYWGAPVVDTAKSQVYVTLEGSGFSGIRALALDTGSSIWWHSNAGGGVPSLHGDRLCLVNAADTLLKCINATDGSLIWSTGASDVYPQNTVLTSDDSVCLGTTGQQILCYSSTGSLNYQVSQTGQSTGVALDNGWMVDYTWVTGTGRLYAYNSPQATTTTTTTTTSTTTTTEPPCGAACGSPGPSPPNEPPICAADSPCCVQVEPPCDWFCQMNIPGGGNQTQVAPVVVGKLESPTLGILENMVAQLFGEKFKKPITLALILTTIFVLVLSFSAGMSMLGKSRKYFRHARRISRR